MNFSDLIESAVVAGDRLCWKIPEGWMQGRTTYGGLSAALAYAAAVRGRGELPPLRSAMISFIGPAGGDVAGVSRVLRQGRSVTFLEADIAMDGALATRGQFCFGAGRASDFNRQFTPMPDLPGPEDCDEFSPPSTAPNFTQHFDKRLARGARPVSGSAEHDHFIWVRQRDPRATGMAALLALADMPPPAVMPMFTEFKPISSMTWMVNVLSAAPQSRDGWWLMESRADNAGEGYSSQDMLVWNSDGELVIAGRQSIAIFV